MCYSLHMGTYIKPTSDIFFRYLFGSEENSNLLLSFINSVMEDVSFPILASIKIKNPFNLKTIAACFLIFFHFSAELNYAESLIDFLFFVKHFFTRLRLLTVRRDSLAFSTFFLLSSSIFSARPLCFCSGVT